ncbi:proteasome regulatory particle lid subunit RPN8 [Sporobolomyces salmoneus]|uniref:proteasome regulatory particle lid subunit RPN8 n=1 Tax=Sporobolomyces salmoneus TaxID=183962 RepID=UPI003170A617
MSTTDSLLSTLSTKSVTVHPLVLLSIQDHFHRVAKGTKKRVVGILLGQDLGPKGYEITNSFAVPFEEDEKDPRTWFLDHNYIESMNDMFKKVNAREKLIGWYHTGPKLRSSDLEINQVIKRYTSKPVMVIVDIRPDGERGSGKGAIPTDAYFAVEEIKDDGTTTQNTFLHVPSLISASEAEEIGVEHLLRDVKNLSVGTLSSRVADQLQSLEGLHSRLLEIKEYLEQVVAGTLPVNHQIIYNLQDVFNLLPNLEGALKGGNSGIEGEGDGKRPFTVATNDQLLVMYLSSLIRAVIALHDLVLNKQTAAETTNEEEEAEEARQAAAEEDKQDKKGKEGEGKSQEEKTREYFTGEKKDSDSDKKKKDSDERGH